MARRVNVGEDFEGKVKLVEAKARVTVAMILVSVGILLLLGAVALGVRAGSFEALQGLWNVQGPIVGAIVSYYFGKGGIQNGRDSQES